MELAARLPRSSQALYSSVLNSPNPPKSVRAECHSVAGLSARLDGSIRLSRAGSHAPAVPQALAELRRFLPFLLSCEMQVPFGGDVAERAFLLLREVGAGGERAHFLHDLRAAGHVEAVDAPVPGRGAYLLPFLQQLPVTLDGRRPRNVMFAEELCKPLPRIGAKMRVQGDLAGALDIGPAAPVREYGQPLGLDGRPERIPLAAEPVVAAMRDRALAGVVDRRVEIGAGAVEGAGARRMRLNSRSQTRVSRIRASMKSSVALTAPSCARTTSSRPHSRPSSETDFGGLKVMSWPGSCSVSPSRVRRPRRMSVFGTFPSSTERNRLASTRPLRPSAAAPAPCQRLARRCSGSFRA